MGFHVFCMGPVFSSQKIENDFLPIIMFFITRRNDIKYGYLAEKTPIFSNNNIFISPHPNTTIFNCFPHKIRVFLSIAPNNHLRTNKRLWLYFFNFFVFYWTVPKNIKISGLNNIIFFLNPYIFFAKFVIKIEISKIFYVFVPYKKQHNSNFLKYSQTRVFKKEKSPISFSNACFAIYKIFHSILFYRF